MSRYANPTFNLAQLNASGIDRSPDEITKFCSSLNTDILLLTESYLTSGNLTTDWTQYHNYAIIPPNMHRGHGGLSILIRPDFPFHVHKLATTNPYQLSITIDRYTIHSLYLPPRLSLSEYRSILHNLSIDPHTIILGDLNTRLGSLVGDSRDNNRIHHFTNWLHHYNLTLWNQSLAYGQPTFETNRGSSIIDFFLSPLGPLTATHLQIHADYNLNSDHHLCSITFHLPSPIAPLPPPSHIRFQWKLQRLQDEDVCNKYIQDFTTNLAPILPDLDQLCQRRSPSNYLIQFIGTQLNKAIYRALDTSVTRGTVRNKNWKWFWNDTLQQLAQQRQHSYRQWQAIPTSNPISKSLAWDNHIADRRQFQQSIKRHRALYWNQFCAKLKSSTANDPKCQERVNNFIKRRRRTAQPTTIYTSPHGPQAGANDMIQHLTEVFGGHDAQAMYPPPEARGIDGPTEAEMELFTPDNIATIIHKLPARKAPGSDHITAEMLKPIVDPLSTFLSRYLYCCWKWALFPTHWRTAQVVPIYKKGDPTLPSNYRPISLTSHFRKLFERLILPYLLTTVRPLDISQGGFRAHRGSLDQSFVLHHLIQQFKHQYHHYPTLVFLDIAAAYDSVDRSIIWRHLDHQQVPKRITRVLQSLFNHINVQVLLANYASSFTRPKKGVLQGSILSPLLYAIFIDTLPVLLRNTPIEKPILVRTVPIGSHSEVSLMQVRRRSTRDRRLDTDITLINATLYADDVAILGSPPAILQLLHAAEQHSNDNGYSWSPTKCRVIRAPAPSPLPSDTPLPPLFPDPPADAGTPFPFRLYNTDIPNTTSFSYLGIPFTYQGIDKSALITNNTNKATNVMRFLKKIGFNQYGVGLHEALTVYRIFVRPVFEYGLAIIDPNHIQQQRIHQCQQLCLAFTLNRSSTARSPTKMLEHLSILPTTQLRLQILQFKFLHHTCISYQHIPRSLHPQ